MKHLAPAPLLACLSALVLSTACGKTDKTEEATSSDEAAPNESFLVTGQLAVGTFGLNATNGVTHVIAFNAESGKTKISEVDEEGNFKLSMTAKRKATDSYVKADGTLDREALAADGFASIDEMAAYSDAELLEFLKEEDAENEGKTDEASPWIITYVNASATGADMVVSRFGSETLDTIAPAGGSIETLELGTVTPKVGERADVDASYAAVLEATGLSTDAAKTLGAVDTVSLRNSNPDIDNNGVFDATEGKQYTLDFHNRFSWVAKGSTAMIDHASFKNKFPEDVVSGLTDLSVLYGGTGIVPELEKSEFSAAPATYRWKFTFADASSAAVDLNNGDTCTAEGGGTTVANDAWCTQTYTVDPSYSRYQLGLEVKTPPEGTYTLEAGSKTFTWTNVEVSDFSAGEGFLALMVSWTVNENGTTSDATDDRLTGLRYKYMKKDATAGWVAATQEEIDLIVKPDSARVGFKVNGTTMSCGWRVEKKPSGTIVFADTDVENACDQNPVASVVTDLKGSGLLWSTFYNAGVSYDDKLGMRFFF